MADNLIGAKNLGPFTVDHHRSKLNFTSFTVESTVWTINVVNWTIHYSQWTHSSNLHTTFYPERVKASFGRSKFVCRNFLFLIGSLDQECPHLKVDTMHLYILINWSPSCYIMYQNIKIVKNLWNILIGFIAAMYFPIWTRKVTISWQLRFTQFTFLKISDQNTQYTHYKHFHYH